MCFPGARRTSHSIVELDQLDWERWYGRQKANLKQSSMSKWNVLVLLSIRQEGLLKPKTRIFTKRSMAAGLEIVGDTTGAMVGAVGVCVGVVGL